MSEAFNAALGLALRSVAAHERFTAEIDRILESKGFESPVIGQVLAHLHRKNLLNDRRCAQLAVDRLIRDQPMSRARISEKLVARGCPEDVAGEILPEGDDLETARAALEKKFPNGAPAEKAARFLYSRGFSEDNIKTLLALP